jgi:hypothetical protein
MNLLDEINSIFFFDYRVREFSLDDFPIINRLSDVDVAESKTGYPS